MIYIDSSIVYNILFHTDLSPRAQQALRIASRETMVKGYTVNYPVVPGRDVARYRVSD